MMKKNEEYWLMSEADYAEKVLSLLGISYTRDDNYKNKDGFTVTCISFEADYDQWKAYVGMMRNNYLKNSCKVQCY